MTHETQNQIQAIQTIDSIEAQYKQMMGFDALILGTTNPLNNSKDSMKNDYQSNFEQQNISIVSKNDQSMRKKSAYQVQWSNPQQYNQFNFTQRFTNKRISKKISQLSKKAVLTNANNAAAFNSLNFFGQNRRTHSNGQRLSRQFKNDQNQISKT